MSVHRRIATQTASALCRARAPASARQVSARALASASVRASPSASLRASPSASPLRALPTARASLRASPVRVSPARASPSPALARAYSTDSDHKLWSFKDVQKLTQSDSDVVLIDAREPGELAATGCIPGAINIPVTSSPDSFFLSEDDFEDRFGFARPSPDTEVVFYCKAGVRSRAAASLAKQAGWTKVGEYPGSWLDWAGSGGAIERS